MHLWAAGARCCPTPVLFTLRLQQAGTTGAAGRALRGTGGESEPRCGQGRTPLQPWGPHHRLLVPALVSLPSRGCLPVPVPTHASPSRGTSSQPDFQVRSCSRVRGMGLNVSFLGHSSAHTGPIALLIRASGSSPQGRARLRAPVEAWACPLGGEGEDLHRSCPAPWPACPAAAA